MKLVKNISFYIIISILITFLGFKLESKFLFKYLQENIIGLLLTLLAINTATLGLIASKIQDIVVNYPQMDFSETIKQMKISLLEQIILIIISILCLLLMDSRIIIYEFKIEIGNVFLVSILIYAINILWDTGKGVFVIIEELQNMNNSQ